MKLLSPDTLNGVFEALGAWFTWMNALKLYRDREIKGVYWPAWIFFAAWGLWNLYYYPSLGQWVSFSAGVLLVSGNLAWVALAVRLWLRNRFEDAIPTPRDIRGPSVEFEFPNPKGNQGIVTECVPCDRYWVPHIYGPMPGSPCPFCSKPVTRSETP